jgi:hypothetical protein|tara:strand:- start:30824 stop:31411 length:588 start_codon:yes stop_codon:yes gene_type:complete
MNNLKHVGRIKSNQRKVVLAYMTVPNEPDNCICVTTENLMAEEHDTLMKLVESDSGQNEDVLANAMARTRLPDGKIMLSSFHQTGKMVKVPTNQVEMTPNTKTTIPLDDLIQAIAQQKGVGTEDLANVMQGQPAATTPVTEAPQTTDGVLTDEELATQYRSQADAMFKEAKRLREQAEELVPTKRKVKTKTEESA